MSSRRITCIAETAPFERVIEARYYQNPGRVSIENSRRRISRRTRPARSLDPVAASVLGLVEPLVGPLDNVVQRPVVLLHPGNPQAHGQTAGDRLLLLQELTHALGHIPGVLQVGFGKDDQELLAAVPADDIVG